MEAETFSDYSGHPEGMFPEVLIPSSLEKIKVTSWTQPRLFLFLGVIAAAVCCLDTIQIKRCVKRTSHAWNKIACVVGTLLIYKMKLWVLLWMYMTEIAPSGGVCTLKLLVCAPTIERNAFWRCVCVKKVLGSEGYLSVQAMHTNGLPLIFKASDPVLPVSVMNMK